MLKIIFFVVSSIVSALCFLLVLRPWAAELNLLDTPDHRKLHSGQVPLVGGLSAFLGFALPLLLFVSLDETFYWFLAGATLLVGVGALDDANDLPASLRLRSQVLAGILLVAGAGQSLYQVGDLFGGGDVVLGAFLGGLVTIAAVIGATNAFNMVDGIDGLIGALAITALLGLAYVFSASPAYYSEFLMTICLVGALLPYLVANLQLFGARGKVFAGDAGSMFIGFAVVWLLVRATQGEHAVMRPVTALWFIAVPLIDMVAIMVRRAKKGQPLMMADREHLHHIFLRAGFSHRQTLLIITFVAVLMAAFGLLGEVLAIDEWLMFLSFLLVFALYDGLLQHAWKLLRFFCEDDGLGPAGVVPRRRSKR
ncbi:UDP-N-acetylglucosamine--undecaprenyl-phosphate N-acetylglucosaminephosphotransferase [Marinobacter nauticus]|uniref:UDP-N-acetylglucosamine--undecaprenyl-phosphate N-acetylglucosaminephosphotransferase n=1 Tax=Marinobacter nauticus TaxID=2743 RepID=UPI001C98E53E|nr:UDP-N-acetylglucosamine--undecaprenyl-phosphate N-acetylglucosaminephosphotransferase [Marinobacter nauticus]MBY5961351.1 UDP-N-acetylglucosamine--undecaprenyl-phosphate N-acetylglucosaminephosphotransferase [Marinobacter nauticus]